MIKTKFECRREDADRVVERGEGSLRRGEGRHAGRRAHRLGRGWVHVRPSNTEPIMRIIAEAPTRAEAEEKVAAVQKVVNATLGPLRNATLRQWHDSYRPRPPKGGAGLFFTPHKRTSGLCQEKVKPRSRSGCALEVALPAEPAWSYPDATSRRGASLTWRQDRLGVDSTSERSLLWRCLTPVCAGDRPCVQCPGSRSRAYQ